MLDLLSGVASIAGLGSAANDLSQAIRQQISLEDALATLVEEKVHLHLPRLQHLCVDGDPTFDKAAFRSTLKSTTFALTVPEDLETLVARILPQTIMTPGATCSPDTFAPVFAVIAQTAARALWNRISRLPHLASEVNLTQNERLLQQQEDLKKEFKKAAPILDDIRRYAADVHARTWNKLEDSAPPAAHTIDQQSYRNPFVLARSEDFNHNYIKLARLFQDSPEWSSIRRRTDNVFIEGGRGTGKSMLLRRLTAQATVAAARLDSPDITLSQVDIDYFGVYVKLTRGYYEQFETIANVERAGALLLAQHELNIEIFDAFVDTLRWLRRERAYSPPQDDWDQVVGTLSRLFTKASPATSLDQLTGIVRFEQDAINDFYRDRSFDIAAKYQGSARDTVTFLRDLSHIFRDRLFPKQEIRLFLLIDEFETLLETQQVAMNTVIKMRLPDLTLKVAVRKAGRKTSETFTPGDPIQDPRDYTPFYVDYDVTDHRYKDLLEGISKKRLDEAGYTSLDIRRFLIEQPLDQEVSADKVASELDAIWKSGKRRSEEPNEEFREKYTTTAVYRVVAKSRKTKSFSGFDQFALLSSGIVSNYIELCKYAFYYALSDQLSLSTAPAIPAYLQSRAAHTVSERLLGTIDGNVPRVGGVLARLVNDLGAVMRARLLHDTSEPEANRVSIQGYNEIAEEAYTKIAEVIDNGITWSVFHYWEAGKAFRPKNITRPTTVEIAINRIYCPVLGISPRARWRITIPLEDLAALTDPQLRDRTFRKLNITVGKATDTQDDLFSK